MTAERKPIFLLADSQPLFRSGGDALLTVLQENLRVAERNVTRAAYIGASNGDAPEFFELFVAAMDGINLHESRMIRSVFDEQDRAFLESADLLLLAGGNVDEGWAIMTNTGMDAVITRKYYSGAVVIGVSAGAMQLGMGWHDQDGGISGGLKLVPYYIDAHSERDEWSQLRRIVAVREEYAKGFGIPFGGAMIYHPDMSIEAVRQPVAEFEKSSKETGNVVGNLLLPGAAPSEVTEGLDCHDSELPSGECLS